MHARVAAIAFAMIATACGGGSVIPPTDDDPPVSLPASPSTSESAGATVATTTAQPGAPATAVTPALGITGSAGDNFDQEHLVADAGSRFVPMDEPVMVAASEVTWLDGDDIVMGIVHGGEAQAFPVDQMAWHHIANTTIAGEPYLVTY